MSELAIRIHAWVSTKLASLRDDERGQDLIEYALFGGLIAMGIAAAAAAAFYSGAVNAMAQGIGECIDFDGVACTPFPAA